MKKNFVIGLCLVLLFFGSMSVFAQDNAMEITPDGNVVVNGDIQVSGDLNTTKVDGTKLLRWYRVSDPITDWAFSKTTGWTADSFSGGLTCNFTGKVTPGTKAIKCVVMVTPNAGSGSFTYLFWRKNGDSAVSDTPYASKEYANMFGTAFNESAWQYWNQVNWTFTVTLWLDANSTAQIAIYPANSAVMVSNPIEEYR